MTITDSLRGNQYEKPREHHKSLKIPKGIIRSRESKDKQYNDQKSRTHNTMTKKVGQKRNNYLQSTTRKLKIEQHETN